MGGGTFTEDYANDFDLFNAVTNYVTDHHCRPRLH